MKMISKTRLKLLLKDPKWIAIAILALALIGIAFFYPFGEKQSFEIEDRCGKFVNLFSHTIGDEGACRSRCRAQCESGDMEYIKAEFEARQTECNYCMCHCG